jgi:hypothetical protein
MSFFLLVLLLEIFWLAAKGLSAVTSPTASLEAFIVRMSYGNLNSLTISFVLY